MPHLPRSLAIVFTCVAAPAAQASADPQPLPMVQEFAGAHAHGMGMAHRAVGAGSEVVLFNPASMALGARYQAEVNYNFTGGQRLNDFAVGVVDSKSSPVAMGVTVSRLSGDREGLNPVLYRTAVAAAYAIGERLAVGAGLKHQRGDILRGDERRNLNLWTGSLGLAVQLGEMVRLAASWENLAGVEPAMQALLVPAWALGGALTLGRLVVAADLRFDRRAERRDTPDLFLGAELGLGTTLVGRGGYRVDTRLDREVVQAATAGLGALGERARVDLGLERELRPGGPWSVYTALQLRM